MKEMKQTYETPTMVTYGKIEEVTLGQGIGLKDLFVFGLNDPIGNCKNGSCQTGS